MTITAKYWIVYNEDKSVLHYGENSEGGSTLSGLSNKEEFNNEQDYLNRLIELNINLE